MGLHLTGDREDTVQPVRRQKGLLGQCNSPESEIFPIIGQYRGEPLTR